MKSFFAARLVVLGLLTLGMTLALTTDSLVVTWAGAGLLAFAALLLAFWPELAGSDETLQDMVIDSARRSGDGDEVR